MSLHLLSFSYNTLSCGIADFLAIITLTAAWRGMHKPESTSYSVLLCKFFSYSTLLFVIVYHFYAYFATPSTGVWNQMSCALIILAGIISIFGLILLSERGFHKNAPQPLIILVFTWATIYMTNSFNFLSMFLAFELMFFPSAYYVYLVGYTKQSTKSLIYLAIWTYIGSFICLCSFAYIYAKTSTLSSVYLSTYAFSQTELCVLSFSFVLGFGVKIPLWPFYYWLIKVHVDSPTGFSIFLSGFLVKTALFCMLRIIDLFNCKALFFFYTAWFVYGVFDASCRMWETVDIKKLIALATVQEMNILVLLAFITNNTNSSTLNCFIVLHGIISTLFFLSVDYVYKLCGSRQVTSVSGVEFLAPKLAVLVWFILVAFRGLPVFAKFYVESDLLIILITTISICAALIFLLATFIGIISFFRIWFTVLYGAVRFKNTRQEIMSNQLVVMIAGCGILTSLIIFLSFMCLFFFLLKSLDVLRSYFLSIKTINSLSVCIIFGLIFFL